MVKQVGGDRVEVTTLVGPDGDAHVYEPTPADAKNLAGSAILFTNGLGFEGWMDRLEKSSGFKGKVVVASTGVKPRTMVEEEGGKEETITDPHAWQSLANGKLYVANIRDGLIAVDPAGKATYEANASKYLDEIAKEEDEREGRDRHAAGGAQEDHHQPRRVRLFRRGLRARDHRAGGREHRERGVAPRTWPRSSARSRAENIPAVFMENITDHRLLDQIASETGAKIGGELYTDALSPADGPAPTYLDMFRHNIATLTAALSA